MCGIIAYAGDNAATNVINGLRHLSYRGYDSWGLVDSNFDRIHQLGPIGEQRAVGSTGHVCIGQTRWATHGPATLENCQPFYNKEHDIIFAHNGVIKNIKTVGSESDSKAMFRRLIDYLKQGAKSHDLCKELMNAKGDNAFLLYLKGHIYPVCTGNKVLYQSENVVASDLSFIDYEPKVLIGSPIILLSTYKKPIVIPHIESGYYMLKEIEQASNTKPTQIHLPRKTVLFGCGSSYNAALFAEYNDFNIKSYQASELYMFCARHEGWDYLAISQSGETQDVVACISMLKSSYEDTYITGYTNRPGSLLTKLVPCNMMNVGPEYGVAATKSFAKTIADLTGKNVVSNFDKLSLEIKKFVEENNFQNYIFLGEDTYYPLALEGELKLKEVAQVWTDAMIASEIKHGPISCVSDQTLVVVVSRFLTADIIANIAQVKSRGAKVCGFINSTELDFSFSSNSPLGDNIIGCQLLAYWTAIKRGLNPDKPKNLAKCVTV